MYVCKYIYIYIYIYIYMWVCVCAYICMYVCMSIINKIATEYNQLVLYEWISMRRFIFFTRGSTKVCMYFSFHYYTIGAIRSSPFAFVNKKMERTMQALIEIERFWVLVHYINIYMYVSYMLYMSNMHM